MTLPIIPNRHGFGVNETTGGRGGEVVHVTNHNPEGKGSWHDALNRTTVRTIAPHVWGYFPPPGGNKVFIPPRGDFSILGEAAGGPVIFKDWQLYLKNLENIYISNVHMGGGLDGFTAVSTKRLVLNHCAFFWAIGPSGGTGETCMIFDGSEDVSLLDCVVAEGYGERHGLTIGHTKRVSVMRTLLHSNFTRSTLSSVGNIDAIINNLYSKWRGLGADAFAPIEFKFVNYQSKALPAQVDVINNAFIPSNSRQNIFHLFTGIHKDSQFYFSGNDLPGKGSDWEVSSLEFAAGPGNRQDWMALSPTVLPMIPGFVPMNKLDVREYVQNWAGPWHQTPMQARWQQEVMDGTGRTSQIGQTPNWPLIEGGASDVIGSMPADPNAVMPSGYTALEEWAHSLTNFPEPGQDGSVPVPTPTPTPGEKKMKMKVFVDIPEGSTRAEIQAFIDNMGEKVEMLEAQIKADYLPEPAPPSETGPSEYEEQPDGTWKKLA